MHFDCLQLSSLFEIIYSVIYEFEFQSNLKGHNDGIYSVYGNLQLLLVEEDPTQTNIQIFACMGRTTAGQLEDFPT